MNHQCPLLCCFHLFGHRFPSSYRRISNRRVLIPNLTITKKRSSYLSPSKQEEPQSPPPTAFRPLSHTFLSHKRVSSAITPPPFPPWTFACHLGSILISSPRIPTQIGGALPVYTHPQPRFSCLKKEQQVSTRRRRKLCYSPTYFCWPLPPLRQHLLFPA